MKTFTQPRHAASALRALVSAVALTLPVMLPVTSAHAASPDFYEFESGQVRPLAKSADGTKLYAVNTPNNTLDVFSISNGGLQLISRVPVGMEPVAVAVRDDGEVWVVNHLSDSVSVVSMNGAPHVVRTLLVGDEPRDIVFAGTPSRAFITTAHRGQHRTDPSIKNVPGAGDPQLTKSGIGRADVWVFDPANLGNALGGLPLKIMTFFADTPRALAVSPDNNTLYVAAFKSGNETTAVNEAVVCDGWNTTKSCVISGKTYPGGNIGPKTNAAGKPAPETGLIVKYDRTKKQWLDNIGRDWSNAVQFSLPDRDVFAVDANTLTEKVTYQHVGTTLFNMAVNPKSGKLYVSNTEANNLTRFEGPGKFFNSTVQGNIAQSRVTVIDNGTVSPRHLNKHIDYSKLAGSAGFDASAKNYSLATPTEIAVSKDGQTMYVAAFGSSKIGVFKTSDIEQNSFDPRTAASNYITVSGGGPSGVVLDEDRGQMYVMTRFDNSVKVVDLASRSEVAKAALLNPEPAKILEGRKFLYDAQLSSANGEAACASCHIFGDEDALAWNLGNPDDVVTTSPLPGKFTGAIVLPGAKLLFGVKSKINGSDKATDFHPMKGPMTTQTLRGMRNSGAMHWRGDRSVGLYGSSATDSNISFINFGGAFQGLLGNKDVMSKDGMQKFADFQLNVILPPNPIRALDNSLNASEQRGKDFYFGARPVDGFKVGSSTIIENNNCNGCHTIDASKGQFGTGLMQSFEGITQILKVPHVRNIYQKIGRFGSPPIAFSTAKDEGFQGDQVRAYGFVHDGTDDTMEHFFTVRVFQPTLNSGFPLSNPDGTRRDVSNYMHAVDTDLAPIVGQQITLTSANAASVGSRIDLLIARAKAPFVSKELGGSVTECDLVASVVEGGTVRGYLFNTASSSFVSSSGTTRSDSALRALANTPGQEVTYTCTPPGSGKRIAYSSL
jgi:DNA-binding beta-propeller fold protein YncE